ncbi:hypothetical protein ERJ70_16845 [Sediminibacillus dalangtanensis]|uniref:Uncharacterized protein n=1 Tax=Sediminibacillus dalangtanensis TaxID=2729421 RepID=A0ABX7VYM9_9BACI|nr:hypothetical protein [Sediminibacillus dalangtanensis]QTN00801.1 hypothetical protein ERJ70_16845 [Sediminibacillus dalangtanensis]
MNKSLKEAMLYVVYYTLAFFISIALFTQIGIGVIMLDAPQSISINYLIGMIIASFIILGTMAFLALWKRGYALCLTGVSLFLFYLTSGLLFDLPSMSQWQGVNTLQILLVGTCVIAIIINATKVTRKMILKKNFA